MTNRDYTRVHAEHGGADGFWDVSFDDLQLSYADVDPDMMRGISIHVADDGAVSLNEGYVPRSPEGRAEQSLFSEYRDAAVLAIRDAMNPGATDNPRFLERTAADEAAIRERLVGLGVAIAGHELDLEDAEEAA